MLVRIEKKLFLLDIFLYWEFNICYSIINNFLNTCLPIILKQKIDMKDNRLNDNFGSNEPVVFYLIKLPGKFQK